MIDRTVVHNKNSIKKGYYDVRESPFHKDDSVPFVEIGSGDTTLVVSSGLHGNEYKGIKVSVNLMEELYDKSLNGSILILPCLSPTGFRTNNRYPQLRNTTYNNDDPNRSFPTVKYNTPTNDFEYFYDRIYKIISSKADYYIDLHCFPGSSIPHIMRDPIYCKEEKLDELERVNTKVDEMVECLGIGEVWSETPDEKKISEEKIKHYYNQGFSTSSLLHRDRVPSITIEVGPESSLDTEMEDYVVNGVLNVMKSIGILTDSPVQLDRYTFDVSDKKSLKHTYVRNKSSGLIYPNPKLKLGEKVEKGERLLKIKNMYGEVQEDYRLDNDSIILGYFPSMISEVMDVSCSIATIEDYEICKTVVVK